MYITLSALYKVYCYKLVLAFRGPVAEYTGNLAQASKVLSGVAVKTDYDVGVVKELKQHKEINKFSYADNTPAKHVNCPGQNMIGQHFAAERFAVGMVSSRSEQSIRVQEVVGVACPQTVYSIRTSASTDDRFRHSCYSLVGDRVDGTGMANSKEDATEDADIVSDNNLPVINGFSEASTIHVCPAINLDVSTNSGETDTRPKTKNNGFHQEETSPSPEDGLDEPDTLFRHDPEQFQSGALNTCPELQSGFKKDTSFDFAQENSDDNSNGTNTDAHSDSVEKADDIKVARDSDGDDEADAIFGKKNYYLPMDTEEKRYFCVRCILTTGTDMSRNEVMNICAEWGIVIDDRFKSLS